MATSNEFKAAQIRAAADLTASALGHVAPIHCTSKLNVAIMNAK